eukprot:m51a1_g1582 putative 60S ribosomal protein L21e (155) ;mRNA; f:117876-118442
MFKRPFRGHGPEHLTTYLRTYKLGDYVDIVANGAEHRGMPYKYYQGKTGRIWNVTARAVGVEVNKKVGNRIIAKRIHVRVEHVRPSQCRKDFVERMRARTAAIAEWSAKVKAGEKLPRPCMRRLPAQPKPAALIRRRKIDELETLTPLRYQPVY